MYDLHRHILLYSHKAWQFNDRAIECPVADLEREDLVTQSIKEPYLGEPGRQRTVFAATKARNTLDRSEEVCFGVSPQRGANHVTLRFNAFTECSGEKGRICLHCSKALKRRMPASSVFSSRSTSAMEAKAAFVSTALFVYPRTRNAEVRHFGVRVRATSTSAVETKAANFVFTH
ncbi:hypothetical protein ANAPC5_01328 [Anaplasma phagocytophilum]|nr:hypothetical protein ANAPC5_01328 [Anaplasma phagocytophilum]